MITLLLNNVLPLCRDMWNHLEDALNTTGILTCSIVLESQSLCLTVLHFLVCSSMFIPTAELQSGYRQGGVEGCPSSALRNLVFNFVTPASACQRYST